MTRRLGDGHRGRVVPGRQATDDHRCREGLEVGLARECGIEQREAFGGRQQQRRCVASPQGGESDLGSEQIGSCTEQFVISAGDGDLHPTTFYDKDNPLAASALEAANSEIIEAALKLGGTITGEHGVGTEKIQFMTKRFTPVEIAAQRSIKTAFDPVGLLNPGIMLPDKSAAEPDVSAFGAAVRAALTRSLRPDPATKLTTGGNTDISVNLGNLSLVVGADATLDRIKHYLDEHGVTCSAIPVSAGKRTIGEVVATATGDERLQVRHALLGADVTVVDVDCPARFGAETMKDVAGYDTKRLYIGAHGAFGALRALIFKITVKP